MGQEADPKFDKKFLAKYDGKIKNIDMFLKKFSSFFYERYGERIEFAINRNMAPQYGLYIKNQIKQDIKNVVKAICEFVSSLGFENKVDLENESIVLSIDPYMDINLQTKYNIKEANEKFSIYGFEFFPINDHHSGAHYEYGSLITINSDENFNNILDKFLEEEGFINYLNFQKIIIEFFKK